MFDFIYIEEEVSTHPRVTAICDRYPSATRIPCQRYGEVFNRRSQDFRLQKQRPALILAAKYGAPVLEAPPAYGIGGTRNFYFSHMLNCLYDCRYCFLQGMYQSAHMVLFVNYEDFMTAIDERIGREIEDDICAEPCFFSGYDCDSLAMEAVTGFAADFLDFFRKRPAARLELRTKSVRTQPLFAVEPMANCIVAFSLTPEEVASRYESGAPPVGRRLEAMRQLQERGWPVGLRFDPLIAHDDCRTHYHRLFSQVFSQLDADRLHSVSLGHFRLTREHYKKLHQLYPEEPLLAHGLAEQSGMISYPDAVAGELYDFCAGEIRRHVDGDRFFTCSPAPELA